MERRLGRGLGSLLGGSALGGEAPAGEEIPLVNIRPNPHQPRREFDAADLEDLRASIQLHGVLQPICVRRNGDVFELIAGERRTRAAQLAGRTTIPAVVREGVSDGEMLELALVENIQRVDLNPLEKARGYRDLMTRLGLSQEQVAERVGVKRATVANQLRLLELPEKVQQALVQELISMGHARALLALRDDQAMGRVLEKVVREGLSVRQVEGMVRRGADFSPAADRAQIKERPGTPDWITDCEQRLRDSLGTRVRIVNQAGYRGQIVVEYFGREELERLLDLLGPRATI